MKKISKINIILALFVVLSACESGFDELNISKTDAIKIDPVFILNRALLSTAQPQSTIVYEMGIVQQIITPNSGVLTGANYNQDNRPVTQGNWQTHYRGVLKNTKDVIEFTKNDANRSNLYNMARILEAYSFMVLTDTYGSIPFKEGGAGYTQQIVFPAYDKQEDIYPALIGELKSATDALSTTAKVESAEILFRGDIAKWKKFGYSLLLRAGMRLSKVNPTLAAATVGSAFSGGVITSNSDNAMIVHDANYLNILGNILNSTEAANFYLAKPFVDALKATSDPRLPAIAVRYVGATSGSGQVPGVANNNANAQIGMPMGKDNGTVAAAATADGLVSFYEYSQVDRRRMGKTTAPSFIITAAQNHLLLAEAKFRGWISSPTTALDFYRAGISTHMDQMASFDVGCAITTSNKETYVSARAAIFAGDELSAINYEYWIASFFNGPEAFANFRRSGFPQLAPNPFPGSEVPGGFINRLTYPNSELSVNSENVQAAIGVQGPDNLTTKVWWAR